MKNKLWLITTLLDFWVCFQSSRFMQDDMYFSSVDAKREVREYEITKAEASKNVEEEVKSNFKLNNDVIEISNNYYSDQDFTYDDYYDYSYASRIRRFNAPNNSWGYYDPYYTNYYWFNNSNSSYFGNSVYSTYSWWGPNFGNNYNSQYWGNDYYGYGSWGNGWYNPWVNNPYGNNWWNPYNPFAYNGWNNSMTGNGYWGDGFCYNNMYYNSYDNNCYWWWWKQEDASITHQPTNFVALMQSNGISKDVVERPSINYTAIREAHEPANNIDSNQLFNTDNNNTAIENGNIRDNKTNSNTLVITNNFDENNTQVNTNKTNANSNVNNKNNNSNTNTTTYKRWDNYKADVNISPNKSDNSNLSKSGVFSEGSRNNNYEYKGSTMPTNKNPTNVGTDNKGKDPKK